MFQAQLTPLLTPLLTPPLPPATMAACLAVVLLAGVVRGFSGFGFSALSVAGLSLMVSPTKVVPTSLLLEIVASLSLLRQVWSQVDLVWLRALVIGNLLHWALWLAPAMLIGIYFGARSFSGMASNAVRKRMVDLIALVAAVAVVSALWPQG